MIAAETGIHFRLSCSICSGPSARREEPAPLWVTPYVGVEAINHYLVEIGATASPGAIALLIIDGAGWHRSNPLAVPDNIVLVKLPPYAPELNPTETIWQYLRANALANSVWETYEAIVEACCNAWRGLIAKPEVITSIGARQWARVSI